MPPHPPPPKNSELPFPQLVRTHKQNFVGKKFNPLDTNLCCYFEYRWETKCSRKLEIGEGIFNNNNKKNVVMFGSGLSWIYESNNQAQQIEDFIIQCIYSCICQGKSRRNCLERRGLFKTGGLEADWTNLLSQSKWTNQMFSCLPKPASNSLGCVAAPWKASQSEGKPKTFFFPPRKAFTYLYCSLLVVKSPSCAARMLFDSQGIPFFFFLDLTSHQFKLRHFWFSWI